MSLADSLADWRPGAVEMARRVDPWPAAAFAGLIGAPEPALKDGDPLPPMWHWFTLLEHPATAEVGMVELTVSAAGAEPSLTARAVLACGRRVGSGCGWRVGSGCGWRVGSGCGWRVGSG